MKQILADWLQRQWYARPAPNPWLQPLSAAFQAAAAARRAAYGRGWKTAERLPVPVIVVGNLSVGGTGKTPLTLWLAEFLGAAGFKPGIVSRGYGGCKSGAPLAVGADSDPREVGDEPLLIARRSGRPVYVFPQRARAGRALLAATDCDLVIADDGLQHYALARDLEIAVIDGARRFGNGACLPAGPLREPPARLPEVDLIVCQGTPEAGEYAMELVGATAVSLRDPSLRKPLAAFAGAPLRAVAGIGHPERFFAWLRRAGLDFEATAFPDHHRFRPQDICFGDGAPVLMTEKDAVKCQALAGEQHWYVPVEAKLPAAFGENLLRLLESKRNGQETA